MTFGRWIFRRDQLARSIPERRISQISKKAASWPPFLVFEERALCGELFGAAGRRLARFAGFGLLLRFQILAGFLIDRLH